MGFCLQGGEALTMKQAIEKKLQRIMKELDAAAGCLEDAGFGSQQVLLDAAADRVEAVQESLAAL